MKLFLKLVMVYFIFVGYYSYAQKSEIQVIDKETKKPIPYANLCFESLINGAKSYSISSLDGWAENKVKEKSLLVISFVGYETVFDTVLSQEAKIIQLTPDLFNLNQVVVTATRTQKMLKDVPAITQLITAKEIETRGITEIATVLQDDVPGIEFHQAGYGTNMKMQGLDANYVLFLIDGEPMAGETEGNIDYARLNMNDVERIEIVKGASSALYGSQAMGGVINIITKKPRDRVEFNMSARFQQYNQINYPDLQLDDDLYTYKNSLDKLNKTLNLTLGSQMEKLMSKTNFVIKSTDAYILESEDTLVMDIIEYDTVLRKHTKTYVPGSEDYTISQVFEYRFSEQFKIRANASYYLHNRYDFKRDNKFDQFEDYRWGLKASYTFSEKSNIEFSYLDDLYNKFEYREKSGERVQEYAHHFYNPKLLVNFSLGEKHLLTAGAEYLLEDMSTKQFSAGRDSLVSKNSSNTIAYFQDDFKLNSKLSFIGGLRLDYHSSFGANVSPKFSAMYKLPPLSLRFNYARGFRSPTIKELYMNWSPIGTFFIKGNPNLQPETNHYLSVSLEYTKSKWNTSVNLYKNWFKNKIDGYWTISEDGIDIYNYTNIDDSDIAGLEVLLKYNIGRGFFISGGYSYIQDHKQKNDINISAIAPHSGNVRLEYSLSKRVYDLKVNFSGVITGAKDYYETTDIVFNGINTLGTFEAHYDAFSLWKISVSQNFHNGINLVIGVDNIFNYKTPIVTFNSNLSPGRRGFISLSLNIDKLYREFSSLTENI